LPQLLQVAELAGPFFQLAEEIADGLGPFVVLQEIGQQAVKEKGLGDRGHPGGEGAAQNRKKIFRRQESPRFGQSPLLRVSQGQHPALPDGHRAQFQAPGQTHFGSRNRSTSGLSCNIEVNQMTGSLTTIALKQYSERRLLKFTAFLSNNHTTMNR
jgi:hypothetical protein